MQLNMQFLASSTCGEREQSLWNVFVFVLFSEKDFLRKKKNEVLLEISEWGNLFNIPESFGLKNSEL